MRLAAGSEDHQALTKARIDDRFAALKAEGRAAFIAYISRFYVRLESMSRFVAATQRAAAATQRVFGIMDRAATVAEIRAEEDASALARMGRRVAMTRPLTTIGS